MNPMDLIKNLKDLQANMGHMEEKLKGLRSEGSSGGDLVKVTVDGTFEAISVHIDPIAVDPRDVKMLEELVAAAFTDAVRKMRPVMQAEMGRLAGSLNLPPDLMGGGSCWNASSGSSTPSPGCRASAGRAPPGWPTGCWKPTVPSSIPLPLTWVTSGIMSSVAGSAATTPNPIYVKSVPLRSGTGR